MSKTEESLGKIKSLGFGITDLPSDFWSSHYQKISYFEEFDLEKQPVLSAYEQVLLHVKERNFDVVQDVKLVKLYSLTYNLVWHNNELKKYVGSNIDFASLVTLMDHKNSYYDLCRSQLRQLKFEFDSDVEKLFKYVIDSAYNSIINSQDLNLSHSKNEPSEIIEHTVSVDKVNRMFQELGIMVNDKLTHKFDKDLLESFAILKFSI